MPSIQSMPSPQSIEGCADQAAARGDIGLANNLYVESARALAKDGKLESAIETAKKVQLLNWMERMPFPFDRMPFPFGHEGPDNSKIWAELVSYASDLSMKEKIAQSMPPGVLPDRDAAYLEIAEGKLKQKDFKGALEIAKQVSTLSSTEKACILSTLIDQCEDVGIALEAAQEWRDGVEEFSLPSFFGGPSFSLAIQTLIAKMKAVISGLLEQKKFIEALEKVELFSKDGGVSGEDLLPAIIEKVDEFPTLEALAALQKQIDCLPLEERTEVCMRIAGQQDVLKASKEEPLPAATTQKLDESSPPEAPAALENQDSRLPLEGEAVPVEPKITQIDKEDYHFETLPRKVCSLAIKAFAVLAAGAIIIQTTDAFLDLPVSLFQL